MNKIKLNYKDNYIKTINTLTPIVSQLKFEIENDKVKLRGNNGGGNCLFIVSAGKENFDFSNNNEQVKLCILDYKKFFTLYNEFNLPTNDNNTNETTIIELEQNKENNEYNLMYISSSKNLKNQFKYKLASDSIIKDSILNSNPKLPPFIVNMKLDDYTLSNIRHRISLIDATEVYFEMENDSCLITGKNSLTGQTYSEEIKMESSVSEKTEKCIKANIFELLPSKLDYVVSFSDTSLIMFEEERTDDINVKIFLLGK